jgi:Tfp pilus assembly protein PilZ
LERIDLRLAAKSDWVKVFDPRDCTVFVAGGDPPAVGETVRVDLTVGDTGPRVIVRGKVISRRDNPEGSLPAGCNVALGPEEREKINYLNGFVRGGLLDLRERRRLPLRLPVTYGGINGPCKSFTRDINEEGVFVVAEEPLPEDSEIHVLITVPDVDEPVSINGVVSHTVVIEDEDVPGMGILFDDESIAAIADVVETLDKRFLSGKLPDEVLL